MSCHSGSLMLSMQSFSDGVRLGLEMLSEDEAGLDIWYSKRKTTSIFMLNTVSDCFLMPMACPHSGVFLISSLTPAWLSQYLSPLIVSCLVSMMPLCECLFLYHALAVSCTCKLLSILVCSFHGFSVSGKDRVILDRCENPHIFDLCRHPCAYSDSLNTILSMFTINLSISSDSTRIVAQCHTEMIQII
jgi:hypothetical protein